MLIESWLLWQIVKVTAYVIAGGLIYAVIVWKLLNWEANSYARRTDSETYRRN